MYSINTLFISACFTSHAEYALISQREDLQVANILASGRKSKVEIFFVGNYTIPGFKILGHILFVTKEIFKTFKTWAAQKQRSVDIGCGIMTL